VDGIAPKEAVVVLGVCTPLEAATVIDLFKQLGSKVTVRETSWKPKGQGTSCPAFYRDPESAGRGWSWPGTVASAPQRGGDTLKVVALRREDAELGDFAREYQENLFLAVVADPGGAIRRSAAFKGTSDFAELRSIERRGAAVVASERFVDHPCDGTDKHRYKVIVQGLRFELKDGDIEKNLDDREVAERGRCSDAEKQLYP
jgi:hypothetical protein